MGFAGKLAFELVTGHAAFVDGAAAGFVPVPLAHAVGAAVGVAFAGAGSGTGSRVSSPPARNP